MKQMQLLRRLMVVFCVLFALFAGGALIFFLNQDRAGQPAGLEKAISSLRQQRDAEADIQRAWLLAQKSGSYRFSTEFEQTTYQGPSLEQVGRPAQVDSLFLEGKTDIRTEELELALWQGGSVLDRSDALEVRVANGQAFGRQAGSEWQAMEDISVSFAPAHDMLGYLHGAQHAAFVGASEPGLRQYSFQLDGPVFAEYMRTQLEDELRRAGKLPAGISLDTARIYNDLVGAGEVWLAEDGLPRRLNLNLEFPQQADGTRVNVALHSQFYDFAPLQEAGLAGSLVQAAQSSQTPGWFAASAAAILAFDWQKAAAETAWLAAFGALGLLFLRYGRRPKVYATFTLLIIMIMVVGPVMEGIQTGDYYTEQFSARAEKDAAQAKDQAQKDLQTSLEGPVWDPTQNPLSAAEARAQAESALAEQTKTSAPGALLTSRSSAVPGASLSATSDNNQPGDGDNDGVPDRDEPIGCVGLQDCDNDGLSDLKEYRLGTRLERVDSDDDTLDDIQEVNGFWVGGRHWYSNPSRPDTNNDGLSDRMECSSATGKISFACSRDTDGDGVPDLVELDNDNDGVEDFSDLSPFNKSSGAYNFTNPFLLKINGLTANEPLFVDFQMVPTSRQQLAYARNVLDWPSNDNEGQVQRMTNTTFASGNPAGSYSPSDSNGDMRLVPLAEIKIPAADASNLFPRINSLTVKRSTVGFYNEISGSGDNITTTPVVWLAAKMELSGANGSTTLAFPSLLDKNNNPVTIDRVKIFQGACPVKTSATPQYQSTSSLSQNGTWALANVALPAIVDGKHAIVLEQGSGDSLKTACEPLGDVANGLLPAGFMFDTARLNSYGITLRDVPNNSGAITHVAAYVPANVMMGRTGVDKQAFGVRMAYWPTGTSLGAGSEVRLIWMVQLLNDDGELQIVHNYTNESWTLAGMNVRQDFEMRSAVIIQNPDDNDNAALTIKKTQERVWAAARVLGSLFASDPVGVSRISLGQNLQSVLESRNGFPVGSLNVYYNRYETQDELANVPANVTPLALANFVSGGRYKPGYNHALVLFAREEIYKSFAWVGADVTLPGGVSTLASYNWKPFAYENGSWSPMQTAKFMDECKVNLTDALKTDNYPNLHTLSAQDRAAAINGKVLLNQGYAMGTMIGENHIVVYDNTFLERPEEPEDKTVERIGNEVVGRTFNLVVQQALQSLVQDPNTLVQLGTVGKLRQFLRDHEKKIDNGSRVAGMAIATAAIGMTIIGLAVNDKSMGNVFVAVAATLSVVGVVLDAAMLAKDIATKGFAQACGGINTLSRAAKIGAVVGMIITAVISVGVFITQWAMGAFNVADLGFTKALATMVATIAAAAIMLAISFIPIAGQIIALVIALIDAVIAGICSISKAAGYDMEANTKVKVPRTGGAEISFCGGITGFVAEGIKFVIFSQSSLVDNMTDKTRLTTSNFQLGLVDSQAGFAVGNGLIPSLRVDNKIVLIDQPIDWKSAFYAWQINWENLDNATHRYDFINDRIDLDVDNWRNAVGLEGLERRRQPDGASFAGHPVCRPAGNGAGDRQTGSCADLSDAGYSRDQRQSAALPA